MARTHASRRRFEMAQDHLLEVMQYLYDQDNLVGHDTTLAIRRQLNTYLEEIGYLNTERVMRANRFIGLIRARV